MAKARIAKDALEQIALNEIRAHRGCEAVFAVEIEYVADLKVGTNWHIVSIGSEAGSLEHASRAVEFAHKKLRQRYSLLANS